MCETQSGAALVNMHRIEPSLKLVCPVGSRPEGFILISRVCTARVFSAVLGTNGDIGRRNSRQQVRTHTRVNKPPGSTRLQVPIKNAGYRLDYTIPPGCCSSAQCRSSSMFNETPRKNLQTTVKRPACILALCPWVAS